MKDKKDWRTNKMTEEFRSRFRTLVDGSDGPDNADYSMFIGPQHN